MNTTAAPILRVTGVQTLDEAFRVEFTCATDQAARKDALKRLARQVKPLCGPQALTGFPSTSPKTVIRLDVPRAGAADVQALATLFTGYARAAELRSRVFPALPDFEVRNGLWIPCVTTDGAAAAYLVATAKVQTYWAKTIGFYLDLDAGSGSCRCPDLIRELHVGIPPLAHWVLRALLSDPSTSGAGIEKKLLYQDGFRFTDVSAKELDLALAILESVGWIESSHLYPASGRYLVRRGDLLRKIPSRSLLDLSVQMMYWGSAN